MNQAYIFIGTNIEPRHNYLQSLRRLAKLGKLVTISSVYETRPIGIGSGQNFYNGAVLLETEYEIHQLKRALRQIEVEMGRVWTADRSAPRPIDLDIVLFNQELIRDAEITIPDPMILERGFMALALAEINPGYIHPVNGRMLCEIVHGFHSVTNHVRTQPEFTVIAKKIVSESGSANFSHAH